MRNLQKLPVFLLLPVFVAACARTIQPASKSAAADVAPTSTAANIAPACKYPTEATDIPDDPTPGTIALTFDDGPDDRLTPRVLNILKKYNIKATFFLIGENIAGNEALVRRELREGHNIGNHTFTHPHLPQTPDAQMKREFLKTEHVLAQFKNPRARVTRFPYGESSCAAEAFAESLHYNIIGWDVDSCDWSYGEGLEKSDCVPKEMQSRYGANYEAWIDHQLAETKGGVILMHDAEKYEADHLEAEIVHLRSLGYKFVELDRGGLYPKLIHDHTVVIKK